MLNLVDVDYNYLSVNRISSLLEWNYMMCECFWAHNLIAFNWDEEIIEICCSIIKMRGVLTDFIAAL